MTILLVDNNRTDLDRIHALIHQYDSEIALYDFSASPEFLEFLDGNGSAFDAVVISVDMPGSIELAGCLRDWGFTGPLVFLSAVNNYAAESYALKAFSYILKPVTAEKLFSLFKNIEEAVQFKKPKDAVLTVKTKQSSRHILFQEIMYVEIRLYRLLFYLSGGEVLDIQASLNSYEPALLLNRCFAHCHRSFIVNMDYIKTLRNNEIILYSGESIPISRRYNKIKDLYMDYISHKTNIPPSSTVRRTGL
jgi:DNA-binding LytR/AlgR family response regulator